MNDRNRQQPGPPYTGDTIVMPRPDRRGSRPPAPPDAPPPETPPSSPGRGRRARPRRSIWKRIRLALLLVLGLLVLGFGLFYWQVSSLAEAIVVPDVRANPPLTTPLLGGFNLLLVGVDERADNPQEGVRSDTLMLLHLDALGGWGSMLSIPRDTQVDLLDVGTTKINVAYSQGYNRAEELYGVGVTPRQGGMSQAAQTVESFLGLNNRGWGARVNYVAQINFNGFAGIIDALGGVTIDVPQRIVDDEYPTEDFRTMRVEFEPGPQLMNGERALIYARTRHGDSDFGRAQRQQQVMRAIVEELRSRGWLGRLAALPGLLRSVQGQDGGDPPVVTTFPIARPDVLLALMFMAATFDPAEINQLRLTPEVVPVTEIGSNLVWDQAGVRALVDEFYTRPSEASEAATVQVLNGTGRAGLAGQITGELEQAGFRILIASDAPSNDVQRTTVYDRNNKPRTSQRLADMLQAERVVGPPPEGVISDADIVVIVGSDRLSQ
ncbi:MAG: LCP family protein [Chloroflexaceae bacterium]|nr:LCP family protein [Chloroflexaceae bacterium]